MSYHNQHMATTISGIRGNVEEIDYKDLYVGITPENAREKMVSNMEYGSTKFSDKWILYNYFRHEFMYNESSYAIGYACAIRNGLPVAGQGMLFRLRRINTESVFEAARSLIRNNLLTLGNITNILNKGLEKRKTSTDAQDGKAYKFYAQKLVQSAVKKANGKRRVAAKSLGVKQKVITYWMDLEVEDILVKPTTKEEI